MLFTTMLEVRKKKQKLSALAQYPNVSNDFSGLRSGKAVCISVITNLWLITQSHVQSQGNSILCEENEDLGAVDFVWNFFFVP